MTTAEKPSLFIQHNALLFFQRFKIFYTLNGPQIQYCIHEIASHRDVSCSIEICLGSQDKRIEVLMFYPGLDLLADTHYFSSVCFFLIIHHFSRHFHLNAEYLIHLRTQLDIFNSFYAHCLDFKFKICPDILDLMVDANSVFQPLDVDLTQILERPF